MMLKKLHILAIYGILYIFSFVHLCSVVSDEIAEEAQTIFMKIFEGSSAPLVPKELYNRMMRAHSFFVRHHIYPKRLQSYLNERVIELAHNLALSKNKVRFVYDVSIMRQYCLSKRKDIGSHNDLLHSIGCLHILMDELVPLGRIFTDASEFFEKLNTIA